MEEQAFLLARAFRDHGGLFLTLFTRDGPPDPETEARYRDEGLPVAQLDMGRFRAETARRLVRLVRAHGVELVHWHFFPALSNRYVWALTALAPRVRHFYTDHTSRPGPGPPAARGPRLLDKKALGRRFARFYGVSQYVLGCVRDGGVWPEPLLCTHFVNTDRFAPDETARAEVRGRLGAGDRFVALLVGQLIPGKGVDVAVRALGRLPGSVVLWVAGEGPEADRLRALAEGLGLGDRVRFLGMCRDVTPLMQAADCLACPSVWHEAAGLVNIEALACGLPVVASAIGGIPEIVDDGRTGFLVPAGDGDALAGAIRRLLDDPEARAAMGRAARATALERYSHHALIPEYLEMYRSGGRPRHVGAEVPRRAGDVPCPTS
jgi:glycosyltransferase involved in cell wall biosynthesis